MVKETTRLHLVAIDPKGLRPDRQIKRTQKKGKECDLNDEYDFFAEVNPRILCIYVYIHLLSCGNVHI